MFVKYSVALWHSRLLMTAAQQQREEGTTPEKAKDGRFEKRENIHDKTGGRAQGVGHARRRVVLDGLLKVLPLSLIVAAFACVWCPFFWPSPLGEGDGDGAFKWRGKTRS